MLIYTVQCDDCGSKPNPDWGWQTIVELRKWLKDDGWTREKKTNKIVDLCPVCNETYSKYYDEER